MAVGTWQRHGARVKPRRSPESDVREHFVQLLRKMLALESFKLNLKNPKQERKRKEKEKKKKTELP